MNSPDQANKGTTASAIQARERSKYRNKAHRSVFDKGVRAAANGRPRFPPYDCVNRSQRDFRNAWLSGYDTEISNMANENERP